MERRIELHRVSVAGFMAALKPRGYRIASAQVGIETYLGANRGRWCSATELITWLYEGQKDGGALYATTIINVSVAKLRKRGVPIENDFGRGYRIL